MPSFRYRTATLLGPWRETSEAAVRDAIRAKQGRRDEDGQGWHWLVPGVIEDGDGAPLPDADGRRGTGSASSRREPQVS